MPTDIFKTDGFDADRVVAHFAFVGGTRRGYGDISAVRYHSSKLPKKAAEFDRCVVIDGGHDDGMLLALLEGWRFPTIDAIILTHWHDDHYGGIKQLWSRHGEQSWLKDSGLFYSWPKKAWVAESSSPQGLDYGWPSTSNVRAPMGNAMQELDDAYKERVLTDEDDFRMEESDDEPEEPQDTEVDSLSEAVEKLTGGLSYNDAPLLKPNSYFSGTVGPLEFWLFTPDLDKLKGKSPSAFDENDFTMPVVFKAGDLVVSILADATPKTWNNQIDPLIQQSAIVRVPHHGSKSNNESNSSFWSSLSFSKICIMSGMTNHESDVTAEKLVNKVFAFGLVYNNRLKLEALNTSRMKRIVQQRNCHVGGKIDAYVDYKNRLRVVIT